MLKHVKGLMLCRILILTVLLAITFIFQISEKKYFFIYLSNNFYYFISIFYIVTIFYASYLKRVKDLRKFAFIQIVIDHIFITGLIYFTGGKDSFFPVAYIFSIIGSSFIFYKRGAFFFASLSSLLYSLLLLFQLNYWIKPPGGSYFIETSQVFYSLITYIATFYIIAFLSGTISEELKKKKRELFKKEEDYNQLENFNRNIIQSLDSGLLTIDLNGKINFLNKTAERILNRNYEELINTTIDLIFPSIPKMIQELKNRESQTLFNYHRYEIQLDNNGKKSYLGFSVSPITALDGSHVGYTLIFQDITKIKEMEEHLKRIDKMAAIGLLASGMAHEIRNPLASLSGSIQMLRSELNLNDYQAHLMDIILRESERLNSLITDFLLFAQPPQIHKSLCNLSKIIDETVELFIHSPYYREGIRIKKHLSYEDIKGWFDQDQIKQVLWNLLTNAAQSITNDGDIVIRVENGYIPLWNPTYSSGNEEKEKKWVMISISDSGIGIPSKDKDKIFEPFFTTKEGGTGLGLSIVHKIIENHNGFIRVESEYGRGSTFTILLPRS